MKQNDNIKGYNNENKYTANTTEMVGDENKNSNDEDSKGAIGMLTVNIYQAAILNKLLPRGFRVELEESALKTL